MTRVPAAYVSIHVPHNKALELTAIASGNVGSSHACTRFMGVPFVVGGSSAGTLDGCGCSSVNLVALTCTHPTALTPEGVPIGSA